jgi:pyridoxine 5-phosphate synthase
MPFLGVNIDHVATVRQARRGNEPDPVAAAKVAERAGADQITVHLREDRRHIQDRDMDSLKDAVQISLNLECACVDEMLKIAVATCPPRVCLVPEKREEITTEGGLDVVGNRERVGEAVKRLQDAGIVVSLFIAPDEAQISMSKELGAEAVELHTGTYANVVGDEQQSELSMLRNASQIVLAHELRLHAGHGLNYTNVVPVAKIPDMEELNIGHSIVSRAIFSGLEEAVREMKLLCQT